MFYMISENSTDLDSSWTGNETIPDESFVTVCLRKKCIDVKPISFF